MGKIITINENDLLKIKENLTSSDNAVSQASVCITEARPEIDEFELGQESDNPPLGGNYCHTNVSENLDFEVSSSDIDLSSFKKKNNLAPIWNEEDELNPKIRLKLLDIADDFWNFVNLTWVKPNGIILTGSICNFNWSRFSDIDLHLIVDFDEIDEKTEFVKDYLDSKKNEWNNEHDGLKILGYPVELYVQDLGEMPKSGGIYDLEQDEWIKKPNSNDIKSIGLNKFSIKDKAASIMTIIDDMYDALNSTNDSHEIEQIGNDAQYLWKKIKDMRKSSLEMHSENGNGNIVYKILRRSGYLDKLWKMKTLCYDRVNSITEGKENKYTVYINGKKDETFSDMNWKRKPKVGKGFYYGGAVFKIKNVTDDSIYAIEESTELQTSNVVNEIYDYFDMFDAAKKMFGVTNNIMECGFILPDGTMLDFSGRHMTDDKASCVGRRRVDHRSIEHIGNENTPYITLSKFIEAGAIRCDCRGAFINLIKRPTSKQILVLSRLIRMNDGCVSVEIGDDDIHIDYVEYENTPYKRIINDILNFFDNKIKPSSLYESKIVLKEYLEKDYNLPLYKYFKWASTASSCEKANDIAYKCSYWIGEYIKKIYYTYTEFGDLLNDDDFDGEDEAQIEMFLNMLEEHNLCDHFISVMQDIMNEYGLYNELPTWCYTDFNRIVKNEWCIHFTRDAYNIAREGFTGGTDNIDNLAYTNAGCEKPSAGYDFAFLIDDKHVDYNDYGNEAVIFRTSGVEIYHYGDNQNQVIFWGPNVREIIPIKQDENGNWVVYGLNEQVLFSASRPSEIAIWATENLPQYRKQIMTGKNGYIPKYYDYKQKKRIPYKLYRNESVKKYITLLKEEALLGEEFNADGSATGNPYNKRWDAERKALKDFICNYGVLMQSKEDNKQGRLYKCFWDKTLSNLIGFNYCLAVQYDEIKNKPKSTIYVRACDRFTPNIRRNLQYDSRGQDNQIDTMDDRIMVNKNYGRT